MRKIQWYLISVITSLLALTACTPKPPTARTGMDEIQTTLANALNDDRKFSYQKRLAMKDSPRVNNELLPPLSVQVPDAPDANKPDHFDISVKDMPAKDFFMGLVSGTKYNMIVDPNTNDKITLNLKNVTVEEALDAVRELYGYEYNETSYGFEILQPKMRTQIFSIDYLNINRTGKSQTQLVSTDLTDITNNGNNGSTTSTIPPQLTNPTSNQQQNGNNILGSGSTVTTKSENDFWGGLKAALTTLISDDKGQWVVVNPQASIIMVHAYPKSLHQVSRYLDSVQGHLKRQVTLEAKILEVQLNNNYLAGIDWKALGLTQTGTGIISKLDPALNIGSFFSLSASADHGNFTTLINLLEHQGNVQTLSSPHISTVNNQEAVIKVGDDAFFVTGYTSNLTPSGTSTATSQSVTLTPFFSGITLDVTPEIGDNKDVTLYIHPSISTVRDEQKNIGLGNQTGTGNTTLTLPLAHSTIRESDNVVHAKSGQIIVIGGLMQTLTKEQIAATPWLSKIPFAGAIGRDTLQNSEKIELVILLKPIITSNKSTMKELKTEQKRYWKLNRGFHFSSLSKTFGSEAEKSPGA